MRKRQLVDTTVGPTYLDVFECDQCAVVEPEASAINWLEFEWVGAQTIVVWGDGVGHALSHGALFCSTACAVEGLQTVRGLGTTKRSE